LESKKEADEWRLMYREMMQQERQKREEECAQYKLAGRGGLKLMDMEELFDKIFQHFVTKKLYLPPLSRQKLGIFKVESFFPPCDVFVLFLYLPTGSGHGTHNCQKLPTAH